MSNVWKIIIALLLSNIIKNLTYGQLDFFQYNTEKNFYAFENIVKFLVNYGLSILIILIIYTILSKLFPKKADK
ncbi:hypothetical protein [Paenibacillus sp. YPG26]|uniref:hypothetical protein n=1 Tax=Paenibacillus sp. YPG26 TaxID=2878915 RepID=UPI00203A8179|nr:hypothetical protein [Paenibacillus sp. YPG26]USB32402.1 hypothetical protein LDO05_13875 [Paenibacillus sp. YPG26]